VTNSGTYSVTAQNAYGLGISLPALVTAGNPKLLGWGSDQYGQLGDGTNANKTLPESLATNAVAVSGGAGHSLFLKSDGTLWAMGYNYYGQLGDGTTTTRFVPGSVASNVVAVAAGYGHSLFLKGDGTLWAVGDNEYGQLGDGTWVTRSRAVAVIGGTNVVAMAAGYGYSLFLKSDGTLWGVGNNGSGQLGDGTIGYMRTNVVAVIGGTNVVAMAAGNSHSLFLKSDGTLWAVGLNQGGQLGDGTTTTRARPECVASNVVTMAAGYGHSLFLKSDSTLWGMGGNYFGELGDGTTTGPQTLPESVASNVVAVAAGACHSVFSRNDGSVWATGSNNFGQLGDGTTTSRLLPVPVSGMFPANFASGSSAYHTLAVGSSLPMITQQPLSQAAIAGSNVTFSVGAVSFVPLSYQWYFNGSAIPTATASNCLIAGVTVGNAGNYTVTVSNLYGSVISAAAALTVLSPPAFNPILTGGTRNADGSVLVGFAGIAGYTYRVETTTNLAPPLWQAISTNVAGTNGLWNYTDTNASGYSQRFYRAYQP
jgi:alpha-tubulin suppressor-like RCC1 family protein